MNDILTLLVWLGTLTFAASGALVAVRKQFDLVGVLVLASVTAVGGGAIRDVTVGILPPTSLTNEPLLWIVALTAGATFMLHRFLQEEGRLLYFFDTLGLAVFAALGAERGVTFQLGFWGTVFAGAVSGVGGGVLRDVLSGQIPGILYRSGDFYASAAAIGAALVYLIYPVSPALALLGGTSLTFAMRLGSRLLGLRLPVPRNRLHDGFTEQHHAVQKGIYLQQDETE
jgi:uncharacterized membrane protein YeiH